MSTNDPHPHLTGQIDHGVVYKKTTGLYTIRTGDRSLNCTLAPKLRYAHNDSAGSIAVGDRVGFIETSAGAAIVDVLPRQNKLSRRSAGTNPGAADGEQIIAANVDQVIPVFAAANPAPHWNLLDRYLVTAEAHDLPAIICITKLDLAQTLDGRLEDDLNLAAKRYQAISYPVILVSAHTGAGLDELSQALAGKISVLLGKSGVGKTSLLNALQPGLGQRVAAVSQATGKGRHTTTHLEMFNLERGGAIIDTPGIREFGLYDIDPDDLASFFPEMRPFLGRCKFGMGCRHNEEPGCAVRKAVMAGAIDPLRYQSYMRMKEDD